MENRLQIEKHRQLIRVFEANQKVYRLLVKEETPERLIRGICDILGTQPGYEHAWMGLFDREGKLNPMTVSEAGQGHWVMGDCLDKHRLPRCIQSAPKNGEAGHPHARTCSGCVLAEKAKNGEAIAFTLSQKTRCYGLMVLSPKKGRAIEPEERQIIQGMADDIALGLDRMDRQHLRDRVQSFMDNALTYTAVIQDHRILYENKGPDSIRQPIVFDPPRFSGVYEGDRERICSAYDALVAGQVPTLQTEFQYYPHSEEAGEKGGDAGLGWAYISARLMPFQGKMSVVVNLMDITDSRDKENVLRIQDKMASLGRITAGIAHEIRNPLSGIYIYLKAMKQICDLRGDVAKVISIIDKVEQASNKIESIIQRVMDFSKAGRPRFVMADLNCYIDEVTKLTAVTLRKSKIILEKQLDPGLPQCWAEPHLIEQVILNLVTNAAEAMKAWDGEKKITLTTGLNPAGDVIRIWVVDTGPGIPKAHQTRIFDPFYTTKTNSSGIGLAICHRIVHDHGGVLTYSEGVVKGAQFLIELPLTFPDRTS